MRAATVAKVDVARHQPRQAERLQQPAHRQILAEGLDYPLIVTLPRPLGAVPDDHGVGGRAVAVVHNVGPGHHIDHAAQPAAHADQHHHPQD